MNRVFEQIHTYRIIPVVVIEKEEDAVPLAEALREGGLSCAEVTLRTEAAERAIHLMTERYPDMLIGAGTVLTIEQVNRAVAAGAKFIVSPGFDPEIVTYCIAKEIPIIPGCATPSEIMQAVKQNLEVVKFFPAETYGGVAAVKALSAPYPNLRFMPTGGINSKNLESYLSCEKVIACGGSFMVSAACIREGQFDKIKEMTKEAVALAASVKENGRGNGNDR